MNIRDIIFKGDKMVMSKEGLLNFPELRGKIGTVVGYSRGFDGLVMKFPHRKTKWSAHIDYFRRLK